MPQRFLHVRPDQENLLQIFKQRIIELEADNKKLRIENAEMREKVNFLEVKSLHIVEQISRIENSTKRAAEELKTTRARDQPESTQTVLSRRTIESVDSLEESDVSNQVLFLEGIVQSLGNIAASTVNAGEYVEKKELCAMKKRLHEMKEEIEKSKTKTQQCMEFMRNVMLSLMRISEEVNIETAIHNSWY